MAILQPFKWYSRVWNKIILGEISDCFSLKEMNIIKRSIKIYPSDISGLEDWYFHKSGKYIKFDTMIARILESKFSGVRCYHGCRPVNIKSYLDNGIIPLRKESAIDFARKVFVSESPEPVTEEAFNIAVRKIKINKRDKVSFFGIDDRLLLRCAGHYLLYGSEYICAIAANLRGVRLGTYDYRQLLKNYGIPTIFRCNIPFKLIPEETLLELSRVIICYLFSPQSEDPSVKEKDFSISISCKLDPQYIVGHYHPTKIRDPFTVKLWKKRDHKN